MPNFFLISIWPTWLSSVCVSLSLILYLTTSPFICWLWVCSVLIRWRISLLMGPEGKRNAEKIQEKIHIKQRGVGNPFPFQSGFDSYLLAHLQQGSAQIQCAASHTPSWPVPACPLAETPLYGPSSVERLHHSAQSGERDEWKTNNQTPHKQTHKLKQVPPCAPAVEASPSWWCLDGPVSHLAEPWVSETRCRALKTGTADSDTQKSLWPTPLLDLTAPPNTNRKWEMRSWCLMRLCFSHNFLTTAFYYLSIPCYIFEWGKKEELKTKKIKTKHEHSTLKLKIQATCLAYC